MSKLMEKMIRRQAANEGSPLIVKNIPTLRILIALLTITSAGMFCGFAFAEEAGSGHYLPGATASFIDMLPDRGTSTFAYLNAFTYYHGSTGASRDLELGGQVAANVKGTVYADTSIFLYQAPWTLLGGQYGAAIAVPYVWLEVKGNLLLTGRRGRFTFGRQAHDTDNGFGDIQLLPLMFGRKKGDLKWQGTFGIYAPTGNFTKGALANVGKNYWTFEPGAAASYLSSKYGFELTAFAGFDFNTENGTTNYQTGDQFHLDDIGPASALIRRICRRRREWIYLSANQRRRRQRRAARWLRGHDCGHRPRNLLCLRHSWVGFGRRS